MKKLLLSALVSVAFATPAFAHNMDNQVETGKIEAKNTVDGMNQNVQDLAPFEKALNQVLRTAEIQLRKGGYNAEADKLNGGWKQMSALYFHGENNFLKLGDHAPLNQWLADTYNMVEAAVGPEKCASLHLDDIKSINYGFPVVIHPSGDPATGQAWEVQSTRFISFHFLRRFLTGWVI